MQNLKITFKINAFPLRFLSSKNGQDSLEAIASDGVLTVRVYYDYNEKPLELNGNVAINDMIDLILLPHRIELYVGGVLVDEDWPIGNRLFEYGDTLIPCDGIDVSLYQPSEEPLPAVITTFENAEGWRPGNGVFVGDCMPYKRGDEYHVIYLKDRRHHRSKWGLGAHQWEHISTKDFHIWSVHPTAVPITESYEGSICTGSWISYGSKEYLYYTVRRGKGLKAPICRSTSYDGYHFTKDKSFGFTVSDRYDGESARDPKVIRDESGVFHMFLTTTLLSENKGCLAHYTSCDMEEWTECDEPIYKYPNSDQPECPDYFKFNGKYYLVFSIRGRALYMVSDKPYEGFTMLTNEPIPCAGVPKCAEWKGKLVFAGFKVIDGYAGVMTFKSATAEKNGALVFEDLTKY